MANIFTELANYRGLFLMVFVLGLGGTFQYGYHISVLNSPSPYIKAFINETWMMRYGTPIPHETLTLRWSLLVSVYSIGGLVGSTCSGYLIGRFGKKRCQLCNCLLPIASALLMGLSRIVGNFEMILVGRCLAGFYAGLGINIHAQFAGEIAPRKLRGLINTTGPLFVTLGKLCGQIIGLRELFGTETLWPQLLLVSGLLSFVQLVVLPFFPDSPPYILLNKGDKEGCMRALKQLWGDRDHQAHIDEIMKDNVSSKMGRKMSALELLKDPSHRCQILVMIGLILCLQLSGANAIYFYSYDVFQEAGFPQDQIAYVSLGVGAFEFVSAMICDSYSWMPYCSVFLTFLFIFLYGAGPAGATISTCVEIFSQVPRVPAFVISGCFSWVGLYILGMVFPYIVETLKHFCFLLFMAFMILALLFIHFIVPETKDKTIAQISQEFNKFNFKKQKQGVQSSNISVCTQHNNVRTAFSECSLSTRL
ncbi:solute carrier family 2, facilitated glucose transporter member 11-like isoform X2 [Pelobates fuscus]|uniref:solute carrier family 2, facilitated glucose transporter member 11-like isoform X2 n=1 Tax=Pelobates fuscus TaxID=191477 RepID=UPI002FE4E44E